MEYKIIQIIPNNMELMARYEDETSPNGFCESPIICFALVEYEDKTREVKPMDMCSDGMVDFSDAASNFMGIH